MVPAAAPGNKTLAVDLGEIHPAAVANERGAVVIFTARELRALNQYRHKKLSTLQARQAKCTKRSRRWKRLQRRKVYLLARNNRQRRDIEHKVTRAVVNHATAEGAGTVYVGDLRDVGNGKRLHRNGQQLLSGWSHGRQIRYLAYKLAAAGIELKDHSERYTTKTCPTCGRHNQSKGRNYRCAGCGFATARDANGAANFLSLVLFGGFGHVRPSSIMYRRVFRRSSLDTAHVAWGQPQEAAGLMNF
jgi:putative transposase